MFRYESLLAVAIGGAVGSLARWGALEIAVAQASVIGAEAADERAVLVTIAINVIGSFLLGLAIAHQHNIGTTQFLAAGAGFAGGLTTFSSFAVEVAEKLDAGQILPAVYDSLGTAVAAVLAAGLGYRVGRIIR